jgi:hypothetical protein
VVKDCSISVHSYCYTFTVAVFMSHSLQSAFIAISRSENDCGKDILAVCREVAIDSILGWSALLQFLDSAAAVTEYKHNGVVKAEMSTAPIFFFCWDSTGCSL